MNRQLIASASPYEQVVGFSRAVRVGPHVLVSATAPTMPDGDPPKDTYGQARRILDILLDAIREAGGEPEDIVRTRIYLTAEADFDEAARAHKDAFEDIRPATGIIIVTGFVDPRWLLQIEAEAFIGE
jgi:enamine deaminase RidA (YjgF/YER057c/UK114 family)